MLITTLGDIEFTNIDVGIKSSVEWFINNLNIDIRLYIIRLYIIILIILDFGANDGCSILKLKDIIKRYNKKNIMCNK